jgi:fatty acid-binding protein DegV
LGNDLVFTFPFSSRLDGSRTFEDHRVVNVNEDHYGVEPPPIQEIQDLIINIHQDHSEVLVITLSSALSRLFYCVEKAVELIGDHGSIKIID